MTVIVRTMGRPELGAALDSLARQTYPSAEVVVIDARGEGGIPVESRVGSFPARLVSFGKPLRRAAAANAGLDHVRGAFVNFLDEDDLIEPGHLEALVRGMVAPPSVGLVYVGVQVFEDDGDTPARILHFEASREALFERNYISLQASLFSADLLSCGCRFDEQFDLLEDWDFVLQVACHAELRRLPEITYRYRSHLGQSGASLNVEVEALAEAHRALEVKWHHVAEPFRARSRNEIRLGMEAHKRGEWREAERYYRGVLARNPSDVNALNLAGMASLHRGDTSLAIELLDRANGVRGDVAGLAFNLGLAYEAAGDTLRAHAAYVRAREIDPQFSRATAAIARLEQSGD